MKRISFTLLLLLSIIHSPLAADIYWTATIGSNWNNPNNWSRSSTSGLGSSCDCLPGSSDRVVFLAGAATCNLDADVSIGDILFQEGFTSKIDINNYSLKIGTTTSRLAAALNITRQIISGSGTITIYSNNNITINNSVISANLEIDISSTPSTNTFSSGESAFFDGTVTVSASKILLNGSTYNAKASFIKTGNNNADNSRGGNVFNGNLSITHKSGNNMNLAVQYGDIYNGDVELNMNTSGPNTYIAMAYGTGTTSYFNRNIKVSSVNNGSNIGGISFGAGGGLSILADGYTITEGSTEFARGTLDIQNLTQKGNTAQTLNLSNTGSASASALRLWISNCSFEGNVSFTASTFKFGNNIFNGTSSFSRVLGGGGETQIAENTWPGGNTFVGEVIITNSTGSSIVLAGSKGDIYKSNATFASVQSQGHFYIATTDTSYFEADIIFSYLSNNGSFRTFGRDNGTVALTGSEDQTIRAIFSGTRHALSPIIPNLKIDKRSGNFVLSYPIQISNELKLKSGNIISKESNIISFSERSSISGANDKSYVEGKVTKRGTDSFMFPIGADGYYRPIGISAPSSSSEFTAEYIKANHGNGTEAEEGIIDVSACEYWDLKRISGSDVQVILTWNQSTYCNNDYITKPEHLRVLHWNGRLWENMGLGSYSGDSKSGQLTSSLRVSSFSPFTFGSSSEENELPIELTYFRATLIENKVKIEWETASETNNDYFTIERSEDGTHFKPIKTIEGAGTSFHKNTYQTEDQSPLVDKSYYRLRQTDFDRKETISDVVLIKNESYAPFYPNPVRRYIHFKLKGENQQIVIKDLSGNIIYSANNTNSIDTESWTSGFYIMEIRNENTTELFRFAKIRE